MQFTVKRAFAIAIPGVGQFLGGRFSKGIDLLLLLAILLIAIFTDIFPLSDFALFVSPLLWGYNIWEMVCCEPQPLNVRRKLQFILVGLLIIGELSNWLFTQNTHKTERLIEKKQITSKINNVDINSQEIQKKVRVEESSVFFDQITELSKVHKSKDNDVTQSYSLVVGAFLSLQRAESVKERLVQTREHDHNVTIQSIQRKKLWHEIHLVGYQTSSEASIALKQLLANHPAINQDRPYILSLLKP